MDTNKILRICGIVCILCGVIISGIVFADGEATFFREIIGPIQIVVGLLFVIVASQGKNKDL